MKELVMVTALAITAGCTRDPVTERAREIASTYGCVSCHKIPGARLAGRVGPPLDNMGAQGFVAGRLPNTRQNLVHWIRNPRDVDPQTVMPDLQVTEADAHVLAAYLQALRR